PSAAATIDRFCSTLHRRRRSGPANTSPPAIVLWRIGRGENRIRPVTTTAAEGGWQYGHHRYRHLPLPGKGLERREYEPRDANARRLSAALSAIFDCTSLDTLRSDVHGTAVTYPFTRSDTFLID